MRLPLWIAVGFEVQSKTSTGCAGRIEKVPLSLFLRMKRLSQFVVKNQILSRDGEIGLGCAGRSEDLALSGQLDDFRRIASAAVYGCHILKFSVLRTDLD